VSDPTLLEILSLGSDPPSVVPHFQSGLFDSLTNVTFDKVGAAGVVAWLGGCLFSGCSGFAAGLLVWWVLVGGCCWFGSVGAACLAGVLVVSGSVDC
jgi:hypothetical protein